MTATPEADSTACEERAVGRIKFDPIGVQFGVPEPNRNVAFGDVGFRLGIGVLAVSSNIQARRCGSSWLWR